MLYQTPGLLPQALGEHLPHFCFKVQNSERRNSPCIFLKMSYLLCCHPITYQNLKYLLALVLIYLLILVFLFRPDPPVLPSCPDKNKVYFNPTGSAFCQFSLVKSLIPKVNILYRDFSSSPSPKSSGTFSSCQVTTTVPILTLQKDLRGDNFSENPKSPSLGLESWKRHQPEDTALFHSSVVV